MDRMSGIWSLAAAGELSSECSTDCDYFTAVSPVLDKSDEPGCWGGWGALAFGAEPALSGTHLVPSTDGSEPCFRCSPRGLGGAVALGRQPMPGIPLFTRWSTTALARRVLSSSLWSSGHRCPCARPISTRRSGFSRRRVSS